MDESHTDTVEIFCENADLLTYQNKFMQQHRVSLNNLFEMRNMKSELMPVY